MVDSRSDTGGVRLYYTNDLLDRAPSQSETGDDTSKTCVRGCDERICSVIDVEHESVGALDQNLSVLLLGRCEEWDLVDDIGSKLLAQSLLILLAFASQHAMPP